MIPPIVRTVGLKRTFGSVTAVDRLDLEVSPGEIFGLVGPDGAGKTTTLRLLCGLIDPDAGDAWVAGFHVARETQAVKDRIGYMAQRFALYGDLTVAENMQFYADLFGISAQDHAALMPRLLRMTRMADFQSRPAGRLSGGMKQKLALMCTLLHKPAVLFLDEPTNGVDPVSRRDFWAILYGLVGEGITIFVTTTYLDEAERCNRVGLMHAGRMIRCDSPEGLRASLKDACYAVEVSNTRAALELLRRQPGVSGAQSVGTVVHLFLDPERVSVERLQQMLAEAGQRAARFQPITPSVEDVFIALIERQESAAGAAAGNGP